MSVGEDALGLLRPHDAPYRYHRDVGHGGLDPRGERHEVRVRERHVRHEGLDGVVVRLGDREIIEHARVREAPHDRDHVLRREPAGGELVAANAEAEGEPGPDHPPHALDHLPREPDAVLQGAPVPIRSMVGEGGHELLKQVAVPGVDLDAVEVPRLRVCGHQRVRVEQLRDVRVRHLVGHLAVVGTGYGRGRPQLALGVQTVVFPAPVVELAEDPGAVGVHHLGDATITGDDRRIVAGHRERAGPGRGVDRLRFRDDEPHPALSLFRIVVGVALVRQVVPVGQVADHRRADDAVPDRYGSDLDRAKQAAELLHAECSLPLALVGKNTATGAADAPYTLADGANGPAAVGSDGHALARFEGLAAHAQLGGPGNEAFGVLLDKREGVVVDG